MLGFSGPQVGVGMDCFKALRLAFDADTGKKYKTPLDIQFFLQCWS